jgi:hypothetical protein
MMRLTRDGTKGASHLLRAVFSSAIALSAALLLLVMIDGFHDSTNATSLAWIIAVAGAVSAGGASWIVLSDGSADDSSGADFDGCPSCAGRIRSDWRLCPHCGARTADVPAEELAQDA